MGIKVIKLEDEEVSCIITGLNFAHSNYQKNGDKEKMLICDKLIDLIDDIDVFLEKKENLKDEKEKNEI